MKKKAPKAKKKVPAYQDGGITSLAPLQSAAPNTRDKKTKNGLGDYLHDYGAATLEVAGNTLGFDPKTTTRTEAGEGLMKNVVDPAASITKQLLPTALNLVAPGAGTLYQAGTGLVGNLTGGDRAEEYEQMLQEGGEVLDTAAAKKPVVVPPKVPAKPVVYAEYDQYNPETKKIKWSSAKANQLMAQSAYLTQAQAVLDAAMRKKLGLGANAPIPDTATLKPEEVAATLKDTPYAGYYGALKKYADTYKAAGANLYGEEAEFIPSVAGETEKAEQNVGDIVGTAYGPRHRSIKFLKRAPVIPLAPVANVVPAQKKGGAVKGYNKGGPIEGGGTAKSDSIDADIIPGSFVVPAENAPIAEVLREKYLGGDKGDASMKQKGGSHVKLSDGEHLFTPEEAAILQEAGVNLALLAPEAKADATGKAKGGPVGEDKIQYSQDRKKVWSNDAGMYVSVNTPTGQNIIKKAKFVLHEGTGEYVPVEKFNKLEGKQPVTAPKKTAATAKPKTTPAAADVAMEELPSKTALLPEYTTSTTGLEQKLRTPAASTTADAAAATGAGKKDDKKGIQFEDALGYGQMGLGLASLFKDGKRPTDQIDADLSAITEKAKADAQYGLDPATKQDYLSDIETGRINNVGLAAQLSGADPTQAMANARAATNAYSKQLLDVASLDARVRQGKQGAAANLVTNRAEMKRRLFEDKMKAFEQNQMAGADLLGAGIENIIGARQAKQTEEFLNTIK